MTKKICLNIVEERKEMLKYWSKFDLNNYLAVKR